MPRTNKRRSADDPVEQPVTPKRRRRRIVWDHRRDKYLLLAIFAHMKVKPPNFQEIADILGNETYSADTLTYIYIPDPPLIFVGILTHWLYQLGGVFAF